VFPVRTTSARRTTMMQHLTHSWCTLRRAICIGLLLVELDASLARDPPRAPTPSASGGFLGNADGTWARRISLLCLLLPLGLHAIGFLMRCTALSSTTPSFTR
jgi:hypothetical protein